MKDFFDNFERNRSIHDSHEIKEFSAELFVFSTCVVIDQLKMAKLFGFVLFGSKNQIH